MIRLITLALLLGTCQAQADARSASKWLRVSKAPASVSYPTGCGFYDKVRRALSEKYGEARVNSGIAGSILIEIYASEKTRTWTVLTVNANGTACIVSAGEMWRSEARSNL